MKPRSAVKFAAALAIVNWVFGLSVLTLFISLAVDWFLPVGEKIWKMPSTEPVEKGEDLPGQAALEDFSICWTGRVLEPAPPAEPAAKAQPAPPPPPPPAPVPVQLPFEWVGAVVDRDPGRCYAILLDRRTRSQILVRQGELIPKTDCRVSLVESDRIHIDSGGARAVVERENRRRNLGGADSSSRSPISVEGGNITIVDGADLERHGLRGGDRIVAVEGRRVESLSQLRESLRRLGKSPARVSVLREGRTVTLAVPSQATARLVAAER